MDHDRQNWGAGSGLVDPTIVGLLVVLLAVAAMPSLIGGVALYLTWRLASARLALGWTWTTGAALVAAAVCALAVHLGGPDALAPYVHVQGALMHTAMARLTGDAVPAFDVPSYLAGVVPLSIPGAFLLAGALPMRSQTP